LVINTCSLRNNDTITSRHLSASSIAQAQTGIIRGTIIDDEIGETLIGATAQIEGTTKGAVTDIEGGFAINNIEPGIYNIVVSYVSYKTLTITGVEVIADKVTELNVRMKTDDETLEEVVITAELIKTSETALISLKKKSVNLIDGISSQTFKKIGDSNAASAIKRVPGVSVQGGKYVYVRGLGDRYTKTTLNGMQVPGLDPDRNTIQLDIFPTNIIDNIVVKKSFTADLPADFTGGIVNIETKDFPTEKSSSASFSLGINPNMHFNRNFLSEAGGSTDFLGVDDGTRNLPVSSFANIPTPTRGDGAVLTEVTRRFNPEMRASTTTSSPNYGFGFHTGNQINKEKITLGYNAALSYKSNTTFYENATLNALHTKNSDQSINELEIDRNRIGSESTRTNQLGGLLGLAAKTNFSKFNLTALHIQNGQSFASLINETNRLRSSNESIRDVVSYTERSITNFLLSGEHLLNEETGLKLEWKLSPTFSSISDKDVRLTPFRVEDGALSIEDSETGNARRLWRFLDEVNYSGKVDVTKDFGFRGLKSKLKFGSSYVFKERDFVIHNFDLAIANSDNVILNGDANNLLTPENIWTAGERTGVFISGSPQLSNVYSSSISNLGFYVSSELALKENFKAIVGLRVEAYTQRYTGVDQDFGNSNGNQGIGLDNAKVLDSFKPFPTVNLIYNVDENSNLRASYAKTIARPSFREQSIAQIFDPISSTTWIGNINLVESDINNYDLRYEYFLPAGQTVAISAFYKTFNNPIEVTVFSENASDNFTARNNGDAKVFGLELEGRKNLGFIGNGFDKFSINVNASIIESRLRINELERATRIANLRDGEELEEVREMQGQSPYLVNVGLSYDNFDHGWESGLFYNVQGRTLTRVGAGNVPDLFAQSFHSLNYSLKKTFGQDGRMSLGLNITNILNDKRETFFRSFGAQDAISSSRDLGRTFKLNLGVTF